MISLCFVYSRPESVDARIFEHYRMWCQTCLSIIYNQSCLNPRYEEGIDQMFDELRVDVLRNGFVGEEEQAITVASNILQACIDSMTAVQITKKYQCWESEVRNE